MRITTSTASVIFSSSRPAYGVDSFYCAECGLALEGLDEIEAAELEVAFDRDEEEELDYSPEYGNE